MSISIDKAWNLKIGTVLQSNHPLTSERRFLTTFCRQSFGLEMAGTAVVLLLMSLFFCCGRCFGKSDSELERFTLATLT